mmetsp:Transcript_23068/g.39426  ORF Transcript_23068/g.39426 Transcript_23068/m.39426 type:complete len:83 (+) Transcript_23068:2874-3122(+)
MDDRQANPGEDIIRSVGIQHYIHIQNAGVDCSFFSAAASGKTLPTYLSSLHHRYSSQQGDSTLLISHCSFSRRTLKFRVIVT